VSDLTFVTGEAGDDEASPRRRGRRNGQSESAPTLHENSEATQTVTVTAPFRVTYEGQSYFPGDIPMVPKEIALQWLKAKWATED
jgi:hypothetical protein